MMGGEVGKERELRTGEVAEIRGKYGRASRGKNENREDRGSAGKLERKVGEMITNEDE